MNSLNERFFLDINGLSLHGGPFNQINVFVALYSPYFIALALVVLYLSGKRNNSLLAFYTALFGLFINFIIGIFYFHPRPFIIGLGNPLISHANDSSFPSDHATLAFSVAFAYLIFKDFKIGAVLFFFALWVGFARVYVGVHFPFDIFGSFVVSLFSVYIVFLFKRPLCRINVFLVKVESYIMKKLKIPNNSRRSF